MPKVGNEADLFNFVPPGTVTGVAIYMFIESQRETRIAMGGPHSGNKMREYALTLLCIMKSNAETSVAGQAALDEFVDSLTSLIEDNRNAGSPPSVVWQWGEGGLNQGPDIQIDYPVPKTINGQQMLFQAVVRLNVCEVIFS